MSNETHEQRNSKQRAIGLALWSRSKGFEHIRGGLPNYFKAGKWMQKILPEEIEAMKTAGFITLQAGSMVATVRRGMPSRKWQSERYVFSDEIRAEAKKSQKSHDEAMVD